MSVGNVAFEFEPAQFICENTILVSVIVPVYNVEKYLERCLESIINQTFEDIEIICVDDGSTDNSGDILDRFAESDSRVVVIHKDNRGASSARNTALSYVRGRYVLFVDSDDWIERNTIEELVSHMTDEIDIVVVGAQIEDEGGDDADRLEELNRIYKSKLSGQFRLDDNFINKVTIVLWGKLFKYGIIKEKGLTFFDVRQYEDNHFTVEYLVHSKICYFVNKDLYHYVRRSSSIMNRGHNYWECLYVFDYLYKRLDQFGLLENYKKTISHRYSEHLRQAYDRSSYSYRNDVMKLANHLSQEYNPVYFNSDLVFYVQNREFSLVPQFDKHVLIVLKTAYETLNGAFKTIKSLFSQSYRMPKVLLYIDSDNIDKGEILLNLPEELCKHADKELLIKLGSHLSLEDTLKELQDFVVVAVESGTVYSPKWLRCVMAAYSDNKEAFASFGFDSLGMVDDAILFRDFAVFDVGVSGNVTIFKPKQTIVSMTSYPARINSAPLALETIFKQTRKPDKVILWLAVSQFPNRYKDLPKELLRLVSEKGLEIRWCEDDLKPHKKYFYAFQEYADALVITIDDDLFYPSERVENLFLSYLLHPYAVSAARAHLIPINEAGEILPYILWPQEIDGFVSKPSMQLCATGVSGILYPTILFSHVGELLDKDAIKRTCLYADDLWLKAMQLVAGIPVVIAEDFQGLHFTSDSQDVGLWHENVDRGGNDRQLLQIEEEIDKRYGKGLFRKKLMDTTVGEKLIGSAALSKLVSFYKGRWNKQVNQIKQQYAKYSTLRVDIRNKGDEGSNVTEQSVTPAPDSLRRPDWLPDGISIESKSGKMSVVLQCQGDGELEIGLMGRDVRNMDGKRYPVWVDCTSFAVNGEVIFNETKTVCHDKRYIYRRAVKDREVIRLDMVWSECQSSNVLDEYKQLQSNLRDKNNKVIQLEREKAKIETEIKQRYTKYSTLRVDIRNKGDEGSNVVEQSVIPAPSFLRRPTWLANGITIESAAGRMTVILQCQGDGELEVELLGRDERNVEGKRYPVWIDCTSFAVNGEVVFNETKTVCHDKRYVYKRAVKDGEIVQLDMVWTECQSSNVLDEYRQLQSELKNANSKASITEVALKKANDKVSATETALKKANDKASATETALKKANDKVSATEVALKKANDKVSATEVALKKANDKVSATETALEKVGNKVIATEAALNNAKAEIVKSNQERQNIAKKLEKEKQKNVNLERDLKNVKDGWSFKVGRVITWLPRKIRSKF